MNNLNEKLENLKNDVRDKFSEEELYCTPILKNSKL